MTDSTRPHRRQPTRLPRPWDSPGKNTGLGCHCLLQCMKVESESEVAQSCLTLGEGYSPPGSSVHGFSRQEYWSGVPLPSPSKASVAFNDFHLPKTSNWESVVFTNLPWSLLKFRSSLNSLLYFSWWFSSSFIWTRQLVFFTSCFILLFFIWLLLLLMLLFDWLCDSCLSFVENSIW